MLNPVRHHLATVPPALLTAELLRSLNLARFEVHLRSDADTLLPPFLGSTLRGAFGQALKAVACSAPHGDCSRCLVIERCLYPRLFETSALPVASANAARPEPSVTPTLLKHRQDAPRPFIFIPPQPYGNNSPVRARDELLRSRVRVRAGEPLIFGLSLLGDAIKELPYVVYAVSLMARHGFGAARAPFVLEKVFALDPRREIYTSGANRIETREVDHTTLGTLVQARMDQLCLPVTDGRAAARDGITLRFITPARLRIKGRLLETPSFAQLISSLSLRLSMLAQSFSQQPLIYDYRSMIELAQGVDTRASTLRLMVLDRFSNRRQGKLELDGFMGEITFAPVFRELLPLLVAGEFLNVGSATAFGLGRYSIG